MRNSDTKPVVILGIDPGYDRVGWAVGQMQNKTYTLTMAGCIQTRKSQTLFLRYQHIILELGEILKKYNPTELAIETLFFSKNKTTALTVSEARGVVIATALEKNCTVFEYTPNQIKLTVTGSGSADKTAVEKMIRYQISLPTGQKLIDDAIDAVGVSLTHALQTRTRFPLS